MSAQTTGHDTTTEHDKTVELVAQALFAWDTEEHPEPRPTWETLSDEQRAVWASGAQVAMAAAAPILRTAERERIAVESADVVTDVMAEHRGRPGADPMCSCGQRRLQGLSFPDHIGENVAARLRIARSAS